MACKKIGYCEYRVSEFVYIKACTGKFKMAYCPLHKESNLKLPKEWRSIQTSPSLPSATPKAIKDDM